MKVKKELLVKPSNDNMFEETKTSTTKIFPSKHNGKIESQMFEEEDKKCKNEVPK